MAPNRYLHPKRVLYATPYLKFQNQLFNINNIQIEVNRIVSFEVYSGTRVMVQNNFNAQTTYTE